MPNGQATSHLYVPKLVSTLREGYSIALLRRDAAAALTVAIVALPLSMAIAVASGVPPERGLYAAIVGGAIVSALGGSRFQIGGPAGAFIVLVSSAVARFGVEGLLLIVLLSGILLFLMGLLRVGNVIRHIPESVTVGFTAGIALTIFASQIRDLAGLRLPTEEPGAFIPKIAALTQAAGTFSPAALAIGLGVAVLLTFIRRLRPNWPGMLIAMTLCALVTALLHLPVETIGTRFGALPSHIPIPRFPNLRAYHLQDILPTVLAFTLLGSIESLLSAKVADSMTGRVHRSNMELLAQGVANICSALFGGISVTGTIARTATNIRAGACTPVSGILHAAFLLLFLLVAAPLARFVPLAALAGVLLVVCWNMVEKKQLLQLTGSRRSGVVVGVTLLLTVLVDLVAGIVAGCGVAALIAVVYPDRR